MFALKKDKYRQHMKHFAYYLTKPGLRPVAGMENAFQLTPLILAYEPVW
jgi:hypothetical protein